MNHPQGKRRKQLPKDFLKELAALLILTGAVVVFFYKVFLPPGVFVAGDVGLSDFTDFFLTTKHFLAESIGRGELPFWTQNTQFGQPILAEGQIQAFFPTTLLYIFLPPITAYNLSIFLMVTILGINSYLLLRHWEVSRGIALFGALGTCLGAPITMRWKHLSILSSLAWFPLEILVVERWFKKPKLTLAIPLASLIALQLLGGHPQITLYSMVAITLFMAFNHAWKINRRPRGDREPLLLSTDLKTVSRSLCFLLLAITIGICLGGVQLLPTWEFAQHAWRQKLTYQQTQEYPFLLKHIITFLVPYSFGNSANIAPYLKFNPREITWEICGYPGLLTTILGAVGMFSLARKKRIIGSLAFLFLASLILAVLNPLYFLPFFSRFRVPGRFIIFASLSLCWTAAVFVNRLANQIRRNHPQKIAVEDLPRLPTRPTLALLTALLTVGLGTDLYIHLNSVNQVGGQDEWLHTPPSAQYLQKNLGEFRYLSWNPPFLYNKIYVKQRGWVKNPRAYLDYRLILAPNSQLLHHLNGTAFYAGTSEDRSGVVAANLRQGIYTEPGREQATVSPLIKKLLRICSVRYVASPQVIEDADFTEAARYPTATGDVYLYEFADPLPRAFVVPQSKFVPSRREIERLMFSPKFDPTEEVLIEKPLPNPPEPPTSQAATVTFTKTEDQELNLEVNSPIDGFLFLSDTYYPGWRVYVNGQEEEILRANFAFRAIPIKKGKSTVVFWYDPEIFRRGLELTVVGALASVVTIYLGKRKQD